MTPAPKEPTQGRPANRCALTYRPDAPTKNEEQGKTRESVLESSPALLLNYWLFRKYLALEISEYA